jgi:hypothetical protein
MHKGTKHYNLMQGVGYVFIYLQREGAGMHIEQTADSLLLGDI